MTNDRTSPFPLSPLLCPLHFVLCPWHDDPGSLRACPERSRRACPERSRRDSSAEEKHLRGSDDPVRLYRVPPKMQPARVADCLSRVGSVIQRLLDRDILVWIDDRRGPTEEEAQRASTVIADRLCGAQANPIIRNA